MAKAVDVLAIQDAVRKKYAAVSSSAAGKFSYSTGRAGALLLGYDPAMASAMPDEVLVEYGGPTGATNSRFTVGALFRARKRSVNAGKRTLTSCA